MDNIVDKLQTHLAEVAQDPSLPFDRALLATLDRGLSDGLSKEAAIGLIGQIAALLPTLQQEPAPVTSLAEVLADSSSFSFTDVLSIQPPIPFVEGLSAQAPAFNIVALSLLEKAGNSTSEAGMLASKFDVVEALMDLWLRTESMAVASKAYNVLALLLGAESRQNGGTDGLPMAASLDVSSASGLMWRRIVTDKDVYGLFFSLCSLKTAGQPGQLSKRRKTIAQARLLEFVQDFCHMPHVWRSQIREVEEAFGVTNGGGLLDFAMVHMVDYKDDLLMHVSLVDAFAAFISKFDGRYPIVASEENISAHSSEGLDFMVSRGLHQRTLDYFLKPEQQDPLELSLIYPAAARYLAAYVSTHSRHFLEVATDTSEQVMQRLGDRMRTTSTNELANDRAPKEELHLVANLPRLALLPRPERDSMFLSLPVRPANVDVLITLAKIFKGTMVVQRRRKGELDTASSQAATMQERAAARALFLLYLGRHPNFWEDLTTIASLEAVKNSAKAAVNLLHSIIDAMWATSDAAQAAAGADVSGPALLLPSESQLQSACRVYGTSPLPKDGISAVLLPPALGHVLPYLLKGAENASEEAFAVANAKFEVLRAFASRLEAMLAVASASSAVAAAAGSSTSDVQTLLAAVRARISQGPLGYGSAEDGGSLTGRLSVATVSR